MSIASRIEQIEQHIENAYESIGNKGVDLRDKLNIDLKGNTSQEVVQGEVGLEEEDTSIYVDDVNEDKENYITLKGNTYQDSTSGKNLYEGSQNFSGTWTNHGNWETDSSTYNGLVVKKRKAAWQGLSKTINVEAGKTYTYSLFIKSDSARSVAIYTDGGTATISPLNKNITTTTSWVRYSLTFTCTVSGTIKARLENITSSDSNYTYICGYQLEESSSMTDYEPYTNGASPNPDYPQEVEVVTGLNEVKVEGKNLIEMNGPTTSYAGITLTNNNDGTFTVTGTSTGAIGFSISNSKPVLKANTAYTQVVKTVSGTQVGSIVPSIRNSQGQTVYNYFSNNQTKTSSEEVKISGYPYYISQAGITVNWTFKVMLCEGTDTTYEAYKGQTYEIDLRTSKNIFDITKILKNKDLKKDTGQLRDATGWYASDWIAIKPNTAYTSSNISSDTKCWYDKNKTFISYVNATTATSPLNAKYLRVNGTLASIESNPNLMIEEGDSQTTYEPYTSIELCKIGTYQDRIYKNNGNWYLHKEIGKYVCNSTRTNAVNDYMSGTNEVSKNGTYSLFLNDTSSDISNNTMYFSVAKYEYNSIIIGNIDAQNNLSDNSFCMRQGTNDRIYFKNSAFTGKTGEEISPLLNGKTLFYVLATPTDTQITDTTLVNQLNALYNATIYSTTHINTETSNLLPYINLKYNVVTASPSPDRASEVEVVTGNNAIKIQSKNLLPTNQIRTDLNYLTVNSDGSFTIKYPSGGNLMYVDLFTTDLSIPLGNYKMQVFVDGTFNGGNLLVINSDGNTISQRAVTDGYVQTITNNDIAKIRFYLIQSGTNCTIRLELEEGTETPTSYVPYQSQTFNITLGNLELCKIGDYQDYFYKDNGNWYKYNAIGKVVLDGSEDWQNQFGESLFGTNLTNKKINTNSLSYCNRFKFHNIQSGLNANLLNGEYTIQIGTNDTLYCKDTNYTNTTDFKNWLNTHNTSVYYVLATPTAIEITNSTLIAQLNALADARKYEDGIETIINQTNSGLSFEIETNPTHLNRNIENISTEIDKIETTEWKPQPDWWDIKTIIKDDEENYPYKIIALQDEGAKTLNIEIDSLFRVKKIKLSDGQEITTSGLYTVNEEGLKNCSKGYKTFYSIWYFNDIPNFSYNSIGHFFRNSKYIYFYNIGNINLNSTFSWVSNQNRLLEAVESNKQITTALSNESFRIIQANCLRKIPDWIFCRNGNIHSPNTIGFSIAPYIKYKDMTKIINSRNFDFTSGTAPEITNSFLDETIDFENDWGMPTTLFTTTSSIIGPYAVQKMDFENVTSFKGTLNVSEVYEVYNIKISNNYFTGEMLSHDTLVRVLNALYNYSDSENTYTLTLGTVNLAKLTNDEKAIATNKGWTLA